MTDRFTIDEYSDVNKIDDNQTDNFYIIANGFDTSELCDLLNKLDNEKQRLYEENIRIPQMLTEAFNNEEDEHTRDILKGLIEQI